MDTIRENGFAFSVGALLVGLVAFLWFWVLSPVFGLGDVESDIGRANNSIKKFLPDDVLKPSRDLRDATETYREDLSRVIEVAKGYYDAKKERFDEWFQHYTPESGEGEYKVARQTEIDQLVSKYLGDFPRESSSTEDGKDDDDDPPPGVVVDGGDITGPEDMAPAQKKLLIIQEVFRVVNELKLGGLMRIHFPLIEVKKKKGEAVVDENSLYAPIIAGIDIDLPLKDLRPFIVAIANSEQVPFVEINSLRLEKAASTLLDSLVVVREYDRRSKAEEEKESFTNGTQPLLFAKIELTAMDWKGLPKDGDTEDDEDNDRK